MASPNSSDENQTPSPNPKPSPSSSEAQNPDPKSESETESKTEPKTESKTPKSPGRPKQTHNQNGQILSYSCPFQNEAKDGFFAPDLVWGKVRSHPWWPGQIHDPLHASPLAAKHRRNKSHLLIAYFGDKTFAWNDASVLKPFQANFARFEKQSRTEGFVTAVDASLAEVSRRVGSALCCPCSKEICEVSRIDNAGIKEGVYGRTGDLGFIRNAFDPVKFVGFVSDLGRNPNCEAERLGLVVAKAQLKAFDRFRGCDFDRPEFNLSFVNFEEDELNIPVSAFKSNKVSSKKRKPKVGSEKPVSEEAVSEKPVIEKAVSVKAVSGPIIEEPVFEEPVSEKPVIEEPVSEKTVSEKPASEEPIDEKPSEKKLIPQEAGRKKRKMSEILEKNENEKTPTRVRKARVGGPTGSSNSGKNKKKSLDSLGDLQNKLRNKKKYLKVGECILRATSPLLKPHSQISQKRKSLTKVSENKNDISVKKSSGNKNDVLAKKSSEKKSGKKKKEREDEFSLEDYSSCSEMLTQLCLAGRDPLRSYSFVNMVTSFFTGFRDYVVNSHEEVSVQKIKPITKRGKRNLVSRKPDSVENEILDFPLSDLFVTDSTEEKLSSLKKKRESQSQTKRKREETNTEGNSVISSEDKPSRQKKKREPTKSRRKNATEKGDVNVVGDSVISNEDKPSRQKKKRESQSQTKSRRKNAQEKGDTNVEGNSVISDEELDIENKLGGDLVISALVLNFNDADAVPSETELNKFFTRFGPLHEDETEVLKESSRAQVVFKNRADAELAFNKAGKFDVFGKALVSFRLSFVKRL